MANDRNAMKRIVGDSFAKGVETTIREIIRHDIGWGNDDEIKQAIRKKAEQILDTNAELQELLLDALRSWIDGRIAEDYRKLRDESRKRFGYPA